MLRHVTAVAFLATQCWLLGGCVDRETIADEIRRDGAGKSRSAASCTGCSVALEHLTTLGAISDPVLPNQEAHVVRTRAGEFRVVGPDRRSILFYDSTGTFTGEAGSRGDGPGEIDDLAELANGMGDSLLARRRDGLIAVMSSDGRPVRSFRLPEDCSLSLVNQRFPCLASRSSGATIDWRDLNGRIINSVTLKARGESAATVRRGGLAVGASDTQPSLLVLRSRGALFERWNVTQASNQVADPRQSSGLTLSPADWADGKVLRGSPLLVGDSAGYVYVVRNIDTATTPAEVAQKGPVLVRTERGLAPAFAAAMEARDAGTVAVVDVFGPDGEWLHEQTFAGRRLRAGAGGVLFWALSNSDGVLEIHVAALNLIRRGVT